MSVTAWRSRLYSYQNRSKNQNRQVESMLMISYAQSIDNGLMMLHAQFYRNWPKYGQRTLNAHHMRVFASNLVYNSITQIWI